MKKWVVALILILWLFSSILCFTELWCFRPLTAVIGMGYVYFLQGDSFTVQDSARYVVIGQPRTEVFFSYMAAHGYVHLPEAQMGRTYIFQNSSGERVPVVYSVNAYFSKWYWEA